MSVLIKGVEIPEKQTLNTFTIFPNGYVAIYDAKDSFIGEAKAFSVPPHGRLIDADALIAKCGGWYTEEGTDIGFIGSVKQLLDEEAPTIIPAEVHIG